MQKIGKKMAEVTLADGEISRLNWIMSGQDQYLENLLNIMKHTSRLTGNVTGNYGDLKTQTEDSIDLLDSKKNSKLTYKLLKSGKISRSSKMVVEELLRIKQVGVQLREASMKAETEYGKVVYQIKNDTPM